MVLSDRENVCECVLTYPCCAGQKVTNSVLAEVERRNVDCLVGECYTPPAFHFAT